MSAFWCGLKLRSVRVTGVLSRYPQSHTQWIWSNPVRSFFIGLPHLRQWMTVLSNASAPPKVRPYCPSRYTFTRPASPKGGRGFPFKVADTPAALPSFK